MNKWPVNAFDILVAELTIKRESTLKVANKSETEVRINKLLASFRI